MKAIAKTYLQTEKGVHPIPETYTEPENDELDTPFAMAELLAAIDNSNKKSAPGRDAIAYKLLANVSGTAVRELLGHIYEAWETSRLPR